MFFFFFLCFRFAFTRLVLSAAVYVVGQQNKFWIQSKLLNCKRMQRKILRENFCFSLTQFLNQNFYEKRWEIFQNNWNFLDSSHVLLFSANSTRFLVQFDGEEEQNQLTRLLNKFNELEQRCLHSHRRPTNGPRFLSLSPKIRQKKAMAKVFSKWVSAWDFLVFSQIVLFGNPNSRYKTSVFDFQCFVTTLLRTRTFHNFTLGKFQFSTVKIKFSVQIIFFTVFQMCT